MSEWMKEKFKTKTNLTPISFTGVVVPCLKKLSDESESDYKLVCSSGLEYFFVLDSDWKNILSLYSWNEVKVIGLLNIYNKTIIPQKVFPKGPQGEIENLIDLASYKGRALSQKLVKSVNKIVPTLQAFSPLTAV